MTTTTTERAATVDSAPDVLAAGQHKHGSTRACLRQDVPADHGAHSQAQRRQLPSESARTRPLETTQLWRDAHRISLRQPPSPDSCHSNTSLAATASLWYSVQRADLRAARGGGEWLGKQPTFPRAARGAACRHVDQHVDVEGAREKRRQRADSSQQRNLPDSRKHGEKKNLKNKARQKSKANSKRKEQTEQQAERAVLSGWPLSPYTWPRACPNKGPQENGESRKPHGQAKSGHSLSMLRRHLGW